LAVGESTSQFEQLLMPHLDAAYNLARWLVRNDQDAEDLVQDSCLRAFKSLDGYRGGDARAWLLAIVRNTCYSWLQRHNKLVETTTEFNEEAHSQEDISSTVEQELLQRVERQKLEDALEAMPSEFREAMVLREIEELSYKEIADVTGVPMGTVMSRLSRGRRWLRERLLQPSGKEAGRAL
jgi:RNA polymerase sigma-70 factor, ECF subfamily